MPANPTRVAVIGQGVIGLTSAIRLREAGFEVEIFSRDEPAKTASMSAGAYWWPYRAYPKQRVFEWAKETHDELRRLAGDPASGVSFHSHLRFCIVPEESDYSLEIAGEWEEIDPARFGVACSKAYRVIVPFIEVPRHMPYLEKRFSAAGGRVHRRELASARELTREYPLVVNCSGVWAGKLTGDEGVFPIRGQAVRVGLPPGLKESMRLVDGSNAPTLILPRNEDCILGGTAGEGDWSLEPDPAAASDILRRCAKLIPALSGCEILGHSVGLRPGRHEVRLEKEELPDGSVIMHNYGHGGAGFTLAWGCANEILHMAESLASPHSYAAATHDP